jgi:hypothetical protein
MEEGNFVLKKKESPQFNFLREIQIGLIFSRGEKVKKEYYILFLIVICVIIGCNPTEEMYHSNYWISIANLDGSEVKKIIRGAGTPYFVQDLNNPDLEKILIEYDYKIELIDLDGTNRITVSDKYWKIKDFNRERSKMLVDGYDLYLCNVDGTELINLTENIDGYCTDPTFSYDEKAVYFIEHTVLSETNIMKLDIETLTPQFITNIDMYLADNEPYHYSLRTMVAGIEDQVLFYVGEYGGNTKSGDIYCYDEVQNKMNNFLNDRYVKAFYSDPRLGLGLIIHDKAAIVDLATAEPIKVVDLLVESITSRDAFSSSGEYFALGKSIYDIKNNKVFETTLNKISINRDETKIIGLVYDQSL